MYNKLTQKQENFTRYIFQGMSQREAWINAGYSSSYSPAVIDVNACRLASNAKIKLRLEKLNGRIDTKSIMSKQERQERLSEIAEEQVKQPVTAKEVIMSIAELNKMAGDYAPEKHALLGDILVEVVYVNKLKGGYNGSNRPTEEGTNETKSTALQGEESVTE